MRALFFLSLGLVYWSGAGCAGGDDHPHHQWLSDAERRVPYIFSTWRGITSSRTVYSFDGTPVAVIVLENVQGPDRAHADSGPPTRPATTRVGYPNEYLVNANSAALTATDVPAGTRVEVDGFVRATPMSIKVRPAGTKYWFVARRTVEKHDRTDRFPQIKVRTIHKLGPDGTRELIWETGVPFEGL
jgi:hypothetical protein